MSPLRCFMCSLALTAQAASAQPSPISFDAPRDYVAGAASVAVGDFNGDAKPDVVAAGRTIRLLIGNGDASLQPPVDLFSGRAPFLGLVVGDFNSDGDADMAAALNDAVGEVLILLGNGDGSFQPAVSYLVGSSPMAIVIADFNGDSTPDLATANSASGGASALFGNGDGTFQPAAFVDVGPRPTSLVVSDFNADSKLDLAATNFWSKSMSTALGNGDGTFQPPTSFVAGYPAFAAVAVDFNADLKQDLMLLCPRDGVVSYYQGNGDGTFAPYAHRGGSNNDPRSAIVADFNGDSRADVAVTYYPRTPGDKSLVFVDLGHDDVLGWLFSTVRGNPYALAAADFDGDSRLDLVIGGDFSIVGVVRGNGDGHFVAMRTVAEGSVTAVGDLNNDGKQDLAGFEGVLLGNGDGSFQPRINYPGGFSIVSAAVADINGDLKADLVGAGNVVSNGVSVLLGNGDGTFGLPSAVTTGPRPQSVAIADFDGDANLDLAVANSGLPPCPLCPLGWGSIALLLGRGDGTFQAPTLLTHVYHPGPVVTGDVDGDLRLDLAVINGRPEPGQPFISILLNNGGGAFETVILPSAWDFSSLAAGDFDGDLRTDLAVRISDQECRIAVAIILGLGDRTFRLSDSFGVIGPCSSGYPVVADFDGDLDLDLATTNTAAGILQVQTGNGDGTFEPAAMFNVSGTSGALIAADFNGDSKPDLVSWGYDDFPYGRSTHVKLLTNTTPWPSSMER